MHLCIFGVPSRLIATAVLPAVTSNSFSFVVSTDASRANGQAERVMSSLKAMLTAVETRKRSWLVALHLVQLAMNCTANRVTKNRPLELLTGKKATGPLVMVLIEEEQFMFISC